MFSGHGLERLFGIRRRQELVDAAVGMAVYDLGDHVAEISERIDELAGFEERRDNSPPPSEPAKSAFLQFSAIGRMLHARKRIDLQLLLPSAASPSIPLRTRPRASSPPEPGSGSGGISTSPLMR